MRNEQAAEILQNIFQRAVDSARPGPVIPPALPEKPKGRCVVIGAGKASAAMAAAVDAAWPDVDVSGVVVTRYGHAVPAGRIRILEAAHPVSDAMSEIAAMLIVESLRGLTPDDLVLALISGGGSALMALPAPGLTLADKQAITRALLHSGANIREMNLVRRHLSAVKGGKLALLAQPARLVSLIISDVPGDNPTDVASGPTVADNSTPGDALKVLERYGIPVAEPVRYVLTHPQQGQPQPGDAETKLIATPALALAAAAAAVRQHGLTPLILGDAIEGESRQVAVVMAGIARSVKQYGHPVKGPAVLLSGGETTVTVTNGRAGKGGRNTEFLLSLACALQGEAGIWAIAGDTDGIDGTEDAAGAMISPDTLTLGKLNGLNAAMYLDEHDSYSYFHSIGDLVITGPTLTNVNDIRAILIA
ncbi:TPA: glycerate kinase [Kluyvera intermedia]|uniref:Hydroxypyruvate reductase n=3 Tax=Enterobacteriaceae TaxID=543 RepID=A0AAC8QKC1_9ENTR|nr:MULTISPECIES: glycerate kinase [Enterobacteriaceae]EJO2888348.1 glycerate kinase [Klebsiella pneumoniae]MCL5502233.1 glycerate kinase [Escherichia coli]MDU1223396.1 glycerate kinase [Citrobacter freundii]MDU6687024.1 glycerate kinase [Enterobacteriaceae bacterium]PWF48139.1 glycerate kinase [[Kluyvera] intestini]HAT2208025.1 glycerate kinase [Kluyvera intermedia]HBQ5718101.1 glycerate kinase [Klebsiella pneumoniae subsp. pneumoniae]HEO1538869.1 glycerate kinase [Klebsiella aerogenes]